MPDETMNNAAAQEAPSQEQAPAEVASPSSGGGQAAPTQAQVNEWMFGGNKYTDPNELHKAAQRWEADITRKNQERASRDREMADRMGQYESIVNVIRNDDALKQLVISKIRAGQNPQEAVREVAQQIPDEVQEQLNTLMADKRSRDMDSAISDFERDHKEMGKEDWDVLGKWLDENEKDLQGVSPARQLRIAYAEAVVPKLKARFILTGQQQKEEEIKKGEKSAFLGSQAPTAGAKPASGPERKRGMTPAQEREYALKVFRAAGKK